MTHKPMKKKTYWAVPYEGQLDSTWVDEYGVMQVVFPSRSQARAYKKYNGNYSEFQIRKVKIVEVR